MSLHVCYADDAVAAASQRGEPVVALRGAKPVEATADDLEKAHATQLVDFSCSRDGRDGPQRATQRFAVIHTTVYTTHGPGTVADVSNETSFTDQGSTWSWAPHVFYVPADRQDLIYVGFGANSLTGWHGHFFSVEAAPDGRFSFELGPLAYEGQLHPEPPDKGGMSIEAGGRITSLAQGQLWCRYVAPSVRRSARPNEL
jgi:hypothetical protein